MRVRVRFFALLRERMGTSEVQLELPSEATLQEALGRLQKDHPVLETYVRDHPPDWLLLSVNQEYATPSKRLSEGDEVALFPPVSGGSSNVDATLEPKRALLLLSGGFDSPVAGHWMREQGFELVAIHFSMEPFTDDASVHKAKRLAARLGIPRLVVVPLGSLLEELARQCDHGCYFVLQKRFMIRVAESFAREFHCSFLVTGENLGQVSSQTLENLGAIDAAASLPVLRPLLGMDKVEIVDRAKAIGTYEVSVGPEICDVLGPTHPHTAVSRKRILDEESKVDVRTLVEQAVQNAFTVEPSRQETPAAPRLSTAPS